MNTQYLQDLGKIILGSEAYIVHKGCVLMHKRSEAKKAFPGYWVGPGGHIDHDEDALAAAIREVQEETGVVINQKNIKLKSVAFHYHLDRKEVFILFIFLSTIPQHQEVKQASIEGKSAWIPMDELFTMKDVFPPSKYYFDHVLNDKKGILYTNIHWNNSELVKVLNRRIDID